MLYRIHPARKGFCCGIELDHIRPLREDPSPGGVPAAA